MCAPCEKGNNDRAQKGRTQPEACRPKNSSNHMTNHMTQMRGGTPRTYCRWYPWSLWVQLMPWVKLTPRLGEGIFCFAQGELHKTGGYLGGPWNLNNNYSLACAFIIMDSLCLQKPWDLSHTITITVLIETVHRDIRVHSLYSDKNTIPVFWLQIQWHFHCLSHIYYAMMSEESA